MPGIFIGIVCAFLAVLLVRTLRFTPKPQPSVSEETITYDKEAAIAALAQLVQCKTISYSDHSLEDDAEFEKLIALLLACISLVSLVSCSSSAPATTEAPKTGADTVVTNDPNFDPNVKEITDTFPYSSWP